MKGVYKLKRGLLKKWISLLLILLLLPVGPVMADKGNVTVESVLRTQEMFLSECYQIAVQQLEQGDFEGAVRKLQVLAGVSFQQSEEFYRYAQGRRAENAGDAAHALILYENLKVFDAPQRLAKLQISSGEGLNAEPFSGYESAKAQMEWYAKVTGNGVNIRPEARKNGSKGQLEKNDIVTMLEEVTGSDGEKWAHIRLANGTEGFIPAKYAQTLTAEETEAYLAAEETVLQSSEAENDSVVWEQHITPFQELPFMPVAKPEGMEALYETALMLLADGRSAAVEQAAEFLEELAEQDYRHSAEYAAFVDVWLLTEHNHFPCAYQKLEEYVREGYFVQSVYGERGMFIPDADMLNDYIFARELEYDGQARSAIGLYEGIGCMNAPERMLHLYEQIDALSPAQAAEGKTLRDWAQHRTRRPDLMTHTIEEVVGNVLNISGAEDLCADEYGAFEAAVSIRPVEAVLILDTSGSMASCNTSNGKNVLSYAQDAAVAFMETLQAINPLSRVGVVGFESNAYAVQSLTEKSSTTQLQTAIRAMKTGGNTNTGGGFQRAREMFAESSVQEPIRIAIMLSDGVANEGPDVMTEGRRLAEIADVYTIGLVSALDDEYREYARSVLNAGYEKQYYEVDFVNVGDISLYLAEAFVKIAAQSLAESGEACYLLQTDGAMEICVHNGSNQILCSETDLLYTESSYGALHLLGDEMDEKIAVLLPGDYDIMLRGNHVGMGTYKLTEFGSGYAAEMSLGEETIVTNPEETVILQIRDGMVSSRIVRHQMTDPMGIDPFSLRPLTGIEEPAQGYLVRESKLYAAPDETAWMIGKIAANTPATVYAVEPASGWYYIGLMDENDTWFRCWVPASAIEVNEYVPKLQVMDDIYALRAGKNAYLSPGKNGRFAAITAAGNCRVIHVERCADGYEWACVETLVEGKKAWVYVTGRSLVGWQTISPENFRFEGNRPELVWQRVFGANGYSEFMWTAPMQSDTGVILSGRTSSKEGYITKPLGNRDAWLMQLGSDGSVVQAMTTGGSQVDSFHCVLPVEQGYYVSGITRSNDRNFSEIWNTGFYNGRSSSVLDRSNALIGFYDRYFNPVWLQSFGIGSASYGFDMVIELADGDIAGIGWSTNGRGSVLNDHGKQDFFAIKMTKDGRVKELNSYGGSVNDVPDSGTATPDGGILMIGSTGTRSESENHTGFVTKLNQSLGQEYYFTYGGSGDNVFDNVRMLEDGTFIVTGYTDSPTNTGAGVSKGGYDFWALRIDSLGRPIWTKRYGGPGDEEVKGTTVLENGNIVILGSTTSQTGDVRGYRRGNTTRDGWALCIDEEGRILWQFCLGGKGNDYFNAAAVDPEDGCLVLAGATEAKDDKNVKAWAVKIRMPEPSKAICP